MSDFNSKVFYCMGDFSFQTDKANVHVNSRPDGSVSVKTTPKDFKATGAVEIYIDRTRSDDGSVEVVISPSRERMG